MQEGKYLYEYAVIRVVPRVEREEFVNVGVILFSKRERYLKMRYVIDQAKLCMFSSGIDLKLLSDNLKAFDRMCQGGQQGGAIATFDTAERFRWITAVKSSSLQTSRPHPGFSDNLDKTLDRLFDELVS